MALADAPRLIDIGGRFICAQVRGSGPTVVLDTGGTGPGIGTWTTIEPPLTEFATVVTYDRAGIGHSDAPPATPMPDTAVADLHALLHALEVPLPAVFSGWSYGGLVVQLYACLHPEDVSGLVLIDPTPYDDYGLPLPLKAMSTVMTAVMPRVMELAAFSGVMRTKPGSAVMKRYLKKQMKDDVTDEFVDMHVRMMSDVGSLTAMRVLLQNLGKAQEQVRTAIAQRGMPDIPLVVLSAADRGKGMAAKMGDKLLALHQATAGKSPQGRVVIAEESTHQMPADQPQLIIDTIREVVEQTTAKPPSKVKARG